MRLQALSRRARRPGIRPVLLLLSLSALTGSGAWAQEPTRPAPDRDRYIMGAEKQLQMFVHVLGQVQRPGEYQVPDGINVMELIARAGGPTEFAELSAVRLTRAGSTPDAAAPPSPRVLYVNLDEYMYSKKPIDVPTLQPGDIVMVNTNSKYRWRLISGILRDLSVIASAYFLGVRAFRN